MRLLVDTNIVVRLRDTAHPRHGACVLALQRLASGPDDPCTCAQVMIEYWAIATRPREVNGLGLSPAQAEADLQEFAQAFLLLPEPPDMADRWRVLANRYVVRGRQAHDTRRVALMQAEGITHLLTMNTADFARYAGVTCLAPEEI